MTEKKFRFENVKTKIRKVDPEKLTPLLLLAISLVFPVLIFERTRLYLLPVGGDTGNWLMTSYALYGIDYPMWDNPLQSHLLLQPIIYPLAKVLGDVQAINIIGLSLLILRPIAIFFFSKKLFKNQFLALLCATVDAFSPAYSAMYVWGGYPNLLGFILLPMAFTYLLNSSIKLKNLVLLFVFSTLITLSHNLTSIIFLFTTYMFLFCKLLKERQYKFTFLTLLVVSLPEIIHRLLVGGVGGTSNYLFFNEFAYNFGLNLGQIVSIFGDSFLLLLLIILSAIGIFEASKSDRNGAVLLVSWLFTPIIFYFGVYYTRSMGINYIRLLWFIATPLIICAVYSMKVVWEQKNKLLLGLATFLIFSSVNIAYVRMDTDINWQKKSLENPSSDVNSYDMVMWISANLPSESVIVTRIPIIRAFIAGIAHRRVLFGGAAPRFYGKQGELERDLAAETILTSNIVGHSDMFIIREETPAFWGHTPYIYMFAGDNYNLLGYFSDHYPYELKKLLANVSEMNVRDYFYEIKYTGAYPNIQTVKTVTLENDEVRINYKILRQDTVNLKADNSIINYFWFAWGKNWEFKNGTLFTDYGDVEVITDAFVEYEYVSVWKQWRLVFHFNQELNVTFKMKNTRIVREDVVLATSDDLIKLYGVTHALIKVNDREAMRWAKSVGWKLAYNNDLFYLYEVYT